MLAGFLAAPSVSQNNNYTLGLLNGRWWNQASEQERLAYLYFYDCFSGLRETDLQRFLPHGEIGRALVEAGFQDVVTGPAERIQKTYLGQEVLGDPFLDRTSTSQLQLISEEAYTQGKRAIISRFETDNESTGEVRFVIGLPLFATIAKRKN